MKKAINILLVSAMLMMLIGLYRITKGIFEANDMEQVSHEIKEVIEEIQPDKEDVETFFGFIVDYVQSDRILSSTDDIALTTKDGYTCYFTYNGESFKAVYTPDNWTIYDSYRVRNSKDMEIICEALIALHPIHGNDMVSYRSAADMAYEWLQHNIAYEFLPEGTYKQSAKDVDLDPYDQGKSLEELFSSRR
ncbi:MAG: hypothetical protein IKS69_02585 [Erysipelotrichaceae bacterium]|nr:hypothetical protein [Erysipelotrichaceae bacterium]